MTVKVSVYLDGSNMRFCGKNEGWVIDYRKFKPFLVQSRVLVDLNYYEGISSQSSAKRFSILKSLGYSLKLFQYKEYDESTREKRVDTQLVADSIYDAFTKEFDVAVLCSGDQDIVPAVEYLLKVGKKVEVVAFNSGLSWALRATTHIGAKIIDISRYKALLSL